MGCIICPFSTAWDDMVVKHQYPLEFAPFENRICGWAKNLGVKDVDTYMKERKWKIKALGNRTYYRALGGNISVKNVHAEERQYLILVVVIHTRILGKLFDINAICRHTRIPSYRGKRTALRL